MRELLFVIELRAGSFSFIVSQMHLNCSFIHSFMCSVCWRLQCSFTVVNHKGKSSRRANLLIVKWTWVNAPPQREQSSFCLCWSCSYCYLYVRVQFMHWILMCFRWGIRLCQRSDSYEGHLPVDRFVTVVLPQDQMCFLNSLFCPLVLCPCLVFVSTRKCPVQWDVSIQYTLDFSVAILSI